MFITKLMNIKTTQLIMSLLIILNGSPLTWLKWSSYDDSVQQTSLKLTAIMLNRTLQLAEHQHTALHSSNTLWWNGNWHHSGRKQNTAATDSRSGTVEIGCGTRDGDSGQGNDDMGRWTRESEHGKVEKGQWIWDCGHGTGDREQGTRESGKGTVDMGKWTWESGNETVEKGQWTWESGHGIVDMGRWIWEGGHGKVNMGKWTGDSGYGTVEKGQWTWDSGHGTVDMGRWKWEGGQGTVNMGKWTGGSRYGTVEREQRTWNKRHGKVDRSEGKTENERNQFKFTAEGSTVLDCTVCLFVCFYYPLMSAIQKKDWRHTETTVVSNRGLYYESLYRTVQFRKDGRTEETHKKMNKLQKIRNGNRVEQLKIIHWNLGSKLWCNKLEDIELLLNEFKPDLCYISEANLWNGLDHHEREILGHEIIYPNTMERLGHARIILLVREGISVVKLNQYMESDTATIWVRVGSSKKKNIIVGGIYRQHRVLGVTDKEASRLELKLEQEERWKRVVKHWKAASNNAKCITMGDINLDYKRWQEPEFLQEKMIEMVQTQIEAEGFSQIVNDITRSWRTQRDTILDHIWTNCGQRTIEHFNHPRGISDHNVIGMKVALGNINIGGQNIRRRKWKNFNKERCLEKFASIDWKELYEQTNPNLANTILEENILKVLDTEAPMGTLQMRGRYLKWLTNETKENMVLRDEAREVARRTQTVGDWDSFRELRNTCTRLQRNDRTKFMKSTYTTIEKEKDSGKLHSMTRDLLGWKRSGPPKFFQLDGKSSGKQKDLANWQAEYYEKKVNDIKGNLPKVRSDPMKILRRSFRDWIPAGRIPELIIKKVTEKEIFNMIAKLKNSHAYGRDLIDGSTVKLAAKYLSGPIAHVVNLSLETETFPGKWKLARICPLLKSTDLDETKPGSFRPVSQLPLISKLAERVVQIQLLNFLEETKQLAANQHGYRKYTNTTTALLQIMDIIATGTDANEITASMCVDQTAAFDCVEHDLLLEKLEYYKLSRSLKNWIKSYLEYRSSFVSIGTAESVIKPLKYGVPQGSVLGPLLYLIYVNEFPAATRDDNCGDLSHMDNTQLFGKHCQKCGSVTIFADDAQFLVTSNDRNQNQESLIRNFDRIVEFLNANGLSVNQGKTGLTEYMSKQKRGRLRGQPPELRVTEIVENIEVEKVISDVNYCRILGANLKNNQSWEAHLTTGKKAILPAVRRQLGALQSLRHVLSRKAKLQLVNSLILSRLIYGISLWGNTTANQKMKVQVVLNRAARFILDKPKKTRQTELMTQCNWLNVNELTRYHSLLQMWKVIRLQVPKYLVDRFRVDGEDRVDTNPPRLQLTELSWRCATSESWNNLPTILREERSMRCFKKCLRRQIIDERSEEREPG